MSEESDRDWIFSDACQAEVLDNGMNFFPVESLAELARDVGINNIHGTSIMSFVGNLNMMIQIAGPFISNNDREGWEEYAKEIVARRDALGIEVPGGYQ